MNPINFTANYLDSANIKYIGKDNIKKDKKVALVELDRKSKADRDAVQNAAYLWGSNGKVNFAWHILDEMEKDEFYPDVSDEHYYALTTQKGGYNKLNENQILGVLMLTEYDTDCSEIEYFQVNPIHIHSNTGKDKKYSGIGQALLKYVIDNYKSKPIIVSSSTIAVDFYKKCGFKQIDPVDKYELCYNV
jgi:pentatricopeptide repeat protein